MPAEVTHHSVRNHVIVSIVIVAIALASAVLAIWGLRVDAIRAAERDSGNLATIFAQQIRQIVRVFDASLDELTEHLAALRDDAPDIYPETVRSEEEHRRLMALATRLPEGTAVAVVDADGHLVSHSKVWPLSRIDLSDRAFFIAHRGGETGLFVSPPVVSRAQFGKPVILFTRRLETARGTFAGVVMVGVPITAFQSIYASIEALTDQTFALLRADGTLLARYPDLKDSSVTRIPSDSPWHGILANGGGSYRSPGVFDGDPLLVAVRAVADFPLVIDVSTSEAAALAGWRQRATGIAAGTGLILIALALMLQTLVAQVRRADAQGAQLRLQEEQLRLQNQRFSGALENMAEGLSMFDADQKLVVCNARFAGLYGLPADLLEPGTPYREIAAYKIGSGVVADDGGDARVEHRVVELAGLRPDEISTRIDELADGRLIQVTRNRLAAGGVISTYEDVTDRHHNEARISYLAQHDLLTGLANRAFFTEKIEDALARLRRHGEPFAVFMLDLDKFKAVNDTLGHPAGDQLLKETAARLKAILRDTDTLARLGGDEFAIIQTGRKQPEDIARLAERIVGEIAAPYDLGGAEACVGTSIGIALAPDHGHDGSTLMRTADLALYAAKAAGRNGFKLFSSEMLEQAHARRLLEAELRTAIAERQFELHYQVLVDAKTRHQAGFEALVRWRHPVRGLVGPAQFIPLAEESKLIVPIGELVLQQACADAATWPAHLKVAVNLSPTQLAQPELLQVVMCALAESGLPPERLELEITETALFNAAVDYVTLIRQIKSLGVSIALDDFGTGYSSLSYLTMFPFDKIKIDQSFTMNLTKRSDCAAIVSAVLALGRGLDIETVAEGVETEMHAGMLRAAGVDLLQGYLFGPPRAAAELVFDAAPEATLVGSAA